MQCVITTRPIPTHATTIPVGLRMRVLSWGDDRSANLVGLTGWPRVSLAAADSFFIHHIRGEQSWVPVQHAQVSAQDGKALALDTESASGAARGTGTPAITTPPGTQAIAAACQDATEIYPQPVLETRVGQDAYAYFDGVRRLEVIAADRLQRAAIDHLRRSGEDLTTEARRHGEYGLDRDSLRTSNGELSVPDSCQGRDADLLPQRTRMETQGGSDEGRSTDRIRSTQDIHVTEAGVSLRWTRTETETGHGRLGNNSQVTPSVPPCLRGQSKTLDQVNAELAGLRDRTPADAFPFDLLPAAPPGPPREAPLPLPVTEYARPERMEFHNAKRFPHQAGEHARRGDWGPEWQIAEVGVESGGRVIFNADNSTRRDDSGKQWRQFVDLDCGEFCDWSGPWQAMENTTETRRHGDVGGVQVCHSDAENLPVVLGSVDHATADSTASEACESPLPSVPLCLRGESTTHHLGPGWRTVLHDGLPVARFGADSQAELPAWLAARRSAHTAGATP